MILILGALLTLYIAKSSITFCVSWHMVKQSQHPSPSSSKMKKGKKMLKRKKHRYSNGSQCLSSRE